MEKTRSSQGDLIIEFTMTHSFYSYTQTLSAGPKLRGVEREGRRKGMSRQCMSLTESTSISSSPHSSPTSNQYQVITITLGTKESTKRRSDVLINFLMLSSRMSYEWIGNFLNKRVNWLAQALASPFKFSAISGNTCELCEFWGCVSLLYMHVLCMCQCVDRNHEQWTW